MPVTDAWKLTHKIRARPAAHDSPSSEPRRFGGTSQSFLKLFHCLMGLMLLEQEISELFSRRDNWARSYR